jgi:RNA polymerase sigma-70 factor (TIGR02943 family)
MTETIDPSTWVDLYADYLYRRALLLVDRPEIAEELVQDTFLSAVQNIDSFKGDSTVKTWLTTILRNKSIDYLRKNLKREVLTDFSEQDPDSDNPDFNKWGIWKDYEQKWGVWSVDAYSSLESKGLREAIEACLKKLPNIQRTIIKLRIFEGLSMEEICNEMALQPSNLSVILFRARLALRTCLDKNWFTKQ